MTEEYDVVIIGSGAGGGTLAHALATAGKRILILERGGFLPREMENWDPESVFVDGRYQSTDTWYDADGTAFQPQVHYFVGGATKLYGAAPVPVAAGGLRRVAARRRRVARVARRLRRLRALVQRGRVALPGARRSRRGSDRGSPLPALSVASGVARVADPTALRRSDGRWLPPVPRPVWCPPRRSERTSEHLHPMHLVRRLSVPRACQGRRGDHRGAADPDTPRTSRCSSTPRSCGSTPTTPARWPGLVYKAQPGLPRWSPCWSPRRLRPGLRPAGRPTDYEDLLRPGRDGTTCSTTAKRWSRFRRRRTTRCARRRWP